MPITPPTCKQRAIVVDEHDNPKIWNEAPCPRQGQDQLLLRTDVVAINPSDTKMRGGFVTPMGILGGEYAGTVIAVGSQVTENIVVGDRVCGAQNEMYAATPDRGAFCEYNVTRGSMWMKIPPSWTTEAAASLPVGISTAGLAMKLLGLPLPSLKGKADHVVADSMAQSAYGLDQERGEMVLVYGGSTATATIAMQMMRLSGLIPIATCSPRHFSLARKNGAQEVWDYKEPENANKIRAYTKGNLKYALDCITTVESMKFCLDCIGRAGGKYVSLDPFPEQAAAVRKMVSKDWVLSPSIFGEGSMWPAPYGRPPDDKLRQFGDELWQLARQLVHDGKLNHHPLRILDGSLEAVIEGLRMVQTGQVSGEKVVVRM